MKSAPRDTESLDAVRDKATKLQIAHEEAIDLTQKRDAEEVVDLTHKNHAQDVIDLTTNSILADLSASPSLS